MLFFMPITMHRQGGNWHPHCEIELMTFIDILHYSFFYSFYFKKKICQNISGSIITINNLYYTIKKIGNEKSNFYFIKPFHNYVFSQLCNMTKIQKHTSTALAIINSFKTAEKMKIIVKC